MSYQLIPIPDWPLPKSIIRVVGKAPPLPSRADGLFICHNCLKRFTLTFRHCPEIVRITVGGYQYYCEMNECVGQRAILIQPASLVIYNEIETFND